MWIKSAGPVGLRLIAATQLAAFPPGTGYPSAAECKQQTEAAGTGGALAWRSMLPPRLVQSEAVENAREASFEEWKDMVRVGREGEGNCATS